ncbi:ribbon-helix-helix domain-containing protein [Haloferax volcanii]|uniref:CopG domain protein n=5 Tax=Halobacteriales TaxID=2235 RepID=D4H0E5_HALVD|nr:ribbon-helix-helix domain-containing protein [Haloferax volcanii]ADE05233.1 CopG domain protein [Haloferax volcanii DS2]MBS8121272.1 ribbon-helix-helix protein, CopG family [Haloferax volcanii]MBS8126280.1 ribbon-helix-helix protein, CopG family [Haloferax volcanii]MBS8130150.1 ribbon-helix-helix protein, CopG family [Haloferax volcanii]MBS8134015.1 ribbon-helix-helix protein, CopG family [Haloferax volcanii]
MSTDTDDGRNDDGGTTKIDVRVPTAMVDAIDEEFARRGYTSRSEAIRDALRDWLNPSVQLSEETLADLQESWAQREAGETISLDDALDRYDVDVDDDQA